MTARPTSPITPHPMTSSPSCVRPEGGVPFERWVQWDGALSVSVTQPIPLSSSGFHSQTEKKKTRKAFA